MDPNNNSLHLPSEEAYAPSAGSAIGVKEAFWALRRDWLFPVFGCLIGLVLAVVYVASITTPYKSSARILLDRSVNRYLQTNKLIDEPTFNEAEISSQVYILSSDSVVTPVVRSMHLTRDIEFVGPPKDDSEPGYWSIAHLKKVVKQAIGWKSNIDPEADPDAALERIATEAVGRRLTVFREDVANVITVTFESEDAKKAAKIANAIADTYIANSLDAKLRSTKIVSEWLQDRLKELKTQSMDADRALQDYKVAHNLVITGKGLLSSEQLANATNQLANASIALAEAKVRLDRIQQMGPEAVAHMAGTDVVSNPTRTSAINHALNNSNLVVLRSQYRDVATKVAEIQSIVGPNHIVVLKLRERMAELQRLVREEELRIGDSYASEFQIAVARESKLASNVMQLREQTEAGGQAEVTMRELESSADALRNLYNSFLQKFKEITATQTHTIPIENASIITRATPALSKSYKKPAAILAGGVMLGLFFGAGIAIAREWAAGVFRTPKSVEQITNLPCVVLPKVEGKWEKANWFSRANHLPIEEFAIDAPYSRFTETLRNLKALIGTCQIADGATVIGIVSSLSKEGKTTVASNLAALLISSSGARTLIIDADLHLRNLTGRLAPGAREGLMEALDQPSRLSSLVCKRPRSGLDVLPCVLADRVPNAAEVLGSHKMEELLLAARKTYDYILIEIPPIMSVVDLKLIERFIDRFVFVIEWGQTKQSLVLEALTEVQTIRERLVGVVLNKVDPLALRSIEAYKGDKYDDYYRE